jgi:hypothetical protein
MARAAMNQDRFQSSTGKAAPSGTQRLAPASTAPLPRANVATALPELREKAAQLVERLESRMELLTHACRQARLPLPGVQDLPPRHRLPPNAAQTVAYFLEVFGKDPKLAQSVQVAIYRFQQVAAALATPDKEVDVDQLRRNVFFLTGLPQEFKRDRILALLFPPTASRVGLVTSAAEQQQTRERREEAVKKAIALGQALAPRMVVARLALETLDKGLGHNVSMVLSAEGRQAKVLALALTGDAATTARLRKALETYEELKATVVQVREGKAELEALKPLVLPLGSLAATFNDHAILRQLFRASASRAAG